MTLIEQYERMLPAYLDDQGFRYPPALAKHHDGKITMASLLVEQELVFQTVVTTLLADLSVKEVVFAVDRYTKPGQGTKYADVLTVFWWDGEHTIDFGFRFGVINYRPLPDKLIEPIDWGNTFWNGIMRKIVDGYARSMQRRFAQATAEMPEKFDEIMRAVREVKARHIRGEKPS